MKRLGLILAVVIFAFSCIATAKYALKPLEGQKILMVIAHEDFHDTEYKTPRKIFEGEGAEVIVASSTKEAKGRFGMKVKPDLLLSKVSTQEYDAVVFVGGGGTTEYYDNKTAHYIVKSMYKASKVIGAICIAPVILAKANILKGKRATVWEGEAKALKKLGVIYTGKPVERDGKIITANSPLAASKFAETIVASLAQRKTK